MSDDVGVLVARFQVPELSESARELIRGLSAAHSEFIVLLGASPLPAAWHDPLDFATRRRMLAEVFGELDIRPIDDVRSDERWSAALDAAIGRDAAVIYGSRAGFVDHYRGRHRAVALEGAPLSPPQVQGPGQDAAFRLGVLWATQVRYPVVMATVDIAIFREDLSELLLARKPGEDLFRFVGGFSDPDDVTYEDSARREAAEETGLAISDPRYVASFRLEDWRYRHERDKVKTHLFAATTTGGTPTADDDIAEVRWFAPDVGGDQVMPEHRDLLVAVQRWRAAQRP